MIISFVFTHGAPRGGKLFPMHVPPEGLLRAHSVAEAYLFASLTYCPRCRRRPIRAEGELTKTASEWRLPVHCAGCGENSELQFDVLPSPAANPQKQINPTRERSHLIDPAGWLALFRVIMEGAATEKNRGDSRTMALEASQCLDEALRFMPPSAAGPGEDAFYSDVSRDRFRSHPEQFQREKLLALRARLPAQNTALNSGSAGATNKKKWWRFW